MPLEACPLTPAAPRDSRLDALKGWLVVAVIIGHFPTSAQGRNPFGALPDWIYYFHIPLFLALSCFFAKPFEWGRLAQRARQILLPYGIWMALSHPWMLLHRPAALLGDSAMGNYARVKSILWFLPALFTVNLLMTLWRRKGPQALWTRSALALLGGGAVALAPALVPWHPRIPFGLDVALFLLPFLLAMDLLWRKRETLSRALGPWQVPAGACALALGGWLVRAFEPIKTHTAFARRIDFAQFSVPTTLPGHLGMGLMGAALLLLACRLPAPRAMAALGRRSMPVFLLHYLVLFALTRTIGWAGENPAVLLAYGLAVTALVAALSMGLARGLTRLLPWTAHAGLS